MTRNDFLFICNENAVDPSIALENERVRDVLKRLKTASLLQSTKLQLELNTILQHEF